MELRTIEGVPIVSTGTYALDSGETTFTEADLADAVRASTDPTIVSPRLKLGHDSKLNDILGDGEPAFGQATNLRLTNNGQTILADYANVPDWLADKLPAHYPGRSIEGGFDVVAPSGNEYKLVISDVALLGTEWPGVTSLDDLAAVLGANGSITEPTKTDEGAFAMAGGQAKRLVAAKVGHTTEKITAGFDVGTLRRIFAKDLTAGKVPKMIGAGEQPKWWTRSVEAGDDGSLSLVIDDEAGHLIEMPVKVQGDSVQYGTHQLRTVAASGGLGPRVLASWPKTGAGPDDQEATMDVDKNALLKRLGLPEDADEAAVTAALAKPPEGADAGADAGAGAGTDADAGSAADAATAALAAKGVKIPEGMVLVDADTLEQVKAGAADGSKVAAKLAEQERDSLIEAAIEGKVPGDSGNARIAASTRDSWVKRFEQDFEGSKKLLTAKAEDGGIAALIPAGQVVGRSGDGEISTGADENAQITAFEQRFFPELATAADGGAS